MEYTPCRRFYKPRRDERHRHGHYIALVLASESGCLPRHGSRLSLARLFHGRARGRPRSSPIFAACHSFAAVRVRTMFIDDFVRRVIATAFAQVVSPRFGLRRRAIRLAENRHERFAVYEVTSASTRDEARSSSSCARGDPGAPPFVAAISRPRIRVVAQQPASPRRASPARAAARCSSVRCVISSSRSTEKSLGALRMASVSAPGFSACLQLHDHQLVLHRSQSRSGRAMAAVIRMIDDRSAAPSTAST